MCAAALKFDKRRETGGSGNDKWGVVLKIERRIAVNVC